MFWNMKGLLWSVTVTTSQKLCFLMAPLRNLCWIWVAWGLWPSQLSQIQVSSWFEMPARSGGLVKSSTWPSWPEVNLILSNQHAMPLSLPGWTIVMGLICHFSSPDGTECRCRYTWEHLAQFSLTALAASTLKNYFFFFFLITLAALALTCFLSLFMRDSQGESWLVFTGALRNFDLIFS